jgi:hypothetical protein
VERCHHTDTQHPDATQTCSTHTFGLLLLTRLSPCPVRTNVTLCSEGDTTTQPLTPCLTQLQPTPAGEPSNINTGTGTVAGILGSHVTDTALHKGMGFDDMRNAAAGDLEPSDPDPNVPAQNQGRLGTGLGSSDSIAPNSRLNGDRYDRSGASRASSYYQQQQRQDYLMQQQQSVSPAGRRGHGNDNYNYNNNGDRSDGRYQHSHPSSDVAVRNTNMDGKSSEFYPDDSYNGFENREGERGGDGERAAYAQAGRRGRELSGGNSGAPSPGRKTPHPSRSSGGKK